MCYLPLIKQAVSTFVNLNNEPTTSACEIFFLENLLSAEERKQPLSEMIVNRI